MDEENREASSSSPLSIESEPQSPGGIDAAPLAEQAPLDARALVAKMVEAGQWPEPELLEQIAARGDEAVEPLIEILRSKPRDWPEEAPLSHAIGLLQVLRHPAAIPELIEIIKAYPDEAGEEAAEALACYGECVFETLLELAGDPDLRGYYRTHVITAARSAAGSNAASRSRLADLLRPMLADAIERAKQPRRDEPRDSQMPEEEFELDVTGELSFLASELTSLADPLARDQIKTAFAEGLIETYTLDEKMVNAMYQRGGDPAWIPPDWLELYRDSHRAQFEFLNRRIEPPPVRSFPSPRDHAPPSPPPVAVAHANIRNKPRIVGRNDPCWCGSGKKYKKCHLGKEAPV